MCGRYVLTDHSSVLAERFGVADPAPAAGPRYNVAPTQVMPVVVHADGDNHVEPMRWGLVPFWSREPGGDLINARAETVAEKRSYQRAFRSQRCIVPASGFFEWTQGGREKTPYLFRLKDQSLMGLAGLYDTWKGGDGREVKSYAIVTCAANALLAPIHGRMPCILAEEDEERWLDPERRDAEALRQLLRPYPPDAMECVAVGTLVNDPRHDTPQVLLPREG